MPAPQTLGARLAGAVRQYGASQTPNVKDEKVGEVGTLKRQRVLRPRRTSQAEAAQAAAKSAVEGAKQRAKAGQDIAQGLAARGGLRPMTEATAQTNSIAQTQAAQQTAMAASISALANIAADQAAAQRGVPVGNAKGAGGLVALAQSQLGVPYVWAESNPKGKRGGRGSGFDCSGFTMWLYNRAYGVELPHMASLQQQRLAKVGRRGLGVGDLVFFNYGRKGPGVADHVGVYIGNGMMIDASSSNGRMVRRPVDWSNFLHGGTLRRR